MTSGLNKINSNKFVNAVNASQASPLQSAEYASQASRTVFSKGLPGGSGLFDVTSGRLVDVRQTPTLGSGGPMQALLQPQYQMVRDPQVNSSYINAIGGQPINSYKQDIDTLVAAGTKFAGQTRDSIFTTEPEDTNAYVNKIDPIQKCAAGEQLMLLRASGAASGRTASVSSIPEAYYNPNALSQTSRLVGVAASEPYHMQYNDAYKVGVMASSAPTKQVDQHLSSLSMASFYSPGLIVP